MTLGHWSTSQQVMASTSIGHDFQASRKTPQNQGSATGQLSPMSMSSHNLFDHSADPTWCQRPMDTESSSHPRPTPNMTLSDIGQHYRCWSQE